MNDPIRSGQSKIVKKRWIGRPIHQTSVASFLLADGLTGASGDISSAQLLVATQGDSEQPACPNVLNSI
jgi:hypothetical protein